MADLVQDLGGSDEAGDVEVVTARVHDTGHGRGPRVRDLLGDRQAVHVPTQQDDRALCQIWPTLAAQDRHDRGQVGAEGDLEVQTRQRLEDAGLGPRVVEAELGSLVQFAAQGAQVRGKSFGDRPRVAHGRARPTKARRERTSRSSRSRSVCNDSPSAAPAIIRRRSRAKSLAVS